MKESILELLGHPDKFSEILERLSDQPNARETFMSTLEEVSRDILTGAGVDEKVVAKFAGGEPVVSPESIDVESFRRAQDWAVEVFGTWDARSATVALASLIETNVDATTLVQNEVIETIGFVPGNVSSKSAPENTPWLAPTLEDFTKKSWAELTSQEQRRITRHFAWSPAMPAESFEDLRLPHHRAEDGAVVFHGVEECASVVGLLLEGNDQRAALGHLKSHYEQYGKTAPWTSVEKTVLSVPMWNVEVSIDPVVSMEGRWILSKSGQVLPVETVVQKCAALGECTDQARAEIESALLLSGVVLENTTPTFVVLAFRVGDESLPELQLRTLDEAVQTLDGLDRIAETYSLDEAQTGLVRSRVEYVRDFLSADADTAQSVYESVEDIPAVCPLDTAQLYRLYKGRNDESYLATLVGIVRIKNATTEEIRKAKNYAVFSEAVLLRFLENTSAEAPETTESDDTDPSTRVEEETPYERIPNPAPTPTGTGVTASSKGTTDSRTRQVRNRVYRVR